MKRWGLANERAVGVVFDEDVPAECYKNSLCKNPLLLECQHLLRKGRGAVE